MHANIVEMLMCLSAKNSVYILNYILVNSRPNRALIDHNTINVIVNCYTSKLFILQNFTLLQILIVNRY